MYLQQSNINNKVNKEMLAFFDIEFDKRMKMWHLWFLFIISSNTPAVLANKLGEKEATEKIGESCLFKAASLSSEQCFKFIICYHCTFIAKAKRREMMSSSQCLLLIGKIEIITYFSRYISTICLQSPANFYLLLTLSITPIYYV